MKWRSKESLHDLLNFKNLVFVKVKIRLGLFKAI